MNTVPLVPVPCEDCRHWIPFEDADSGRCPFKHKSTAPDDTCPDSESRFTHKIYRDQK